MSAFAGYVTDAFDALTPDLNSTYESARTYSLSGWKSLQSTLATSAGVAASALPGLHLVAVAADVAFLMNRMSVCSHGIGAIIGSDNGHNNILEEEDFAVILGRWAGEAALSDAAITKAVAEVGIKVGGKVGGKVAAKAVAKFAVQNAGILVGKKLGGKLGAKLGAKFGAKLGGKVVGGFLPFVGPVLSGGINLYFITSIATEAESWYRLKIKL